MVTPLSPLVLPSSHRITFSMSPSLSPSSPAPHISASPPSPPPSLYTVLGLATAAPPSASAYTPSPAAATPKSSLYTVLGVAAEATAPEIKAAYRRMARVCHPDSGGDTSSGEFIRVRDAYVTLSDPEKRADYDRKLFPSPPLHRRMNSVYTGVTAAAGGGFCSYTRRNWESDQFL